MARPLYTPHGRPLTVLYADVDRWAREQGEAFVGTAGSVSVRENASGFRYYGHQYYDADGKKRERYVAGPVGDPAAEAATDLVRARIADLKEIVPSLRLLGREGFALVDGRTWATLAALHNYGLFRAGGALIGSHAYGVLLNTLGIRAPAYATEDVDVARRQRLELPVTPEGGLLAILQTSGLPFVPVPSLDPGTPPTSFKPKGKAAFHVDLLVPSRDDSFPVVPVTELSAHAIGLPYLGYLLGETQTGCILAREGACSVTIPVPERFAVHKVLLSQLRRRDPKSRKDLDQAAVLLAALSDLHPGAIAAALAKVPKTARGRLRAGLASVRSLLGDHPRAVEELSS